MTDTDPTPQHTHACVETRLGHARHVCGCGEAWDGAASLFYGTCTASPPEVSRG
jgi:hypothetical protein